MTDQTLKQTLDEWIVREDVVGASRSGEDGSQHSVRFPYAIDDQAYEAFVDIDAEAQVLSVCVYAPIRVPADRLDVLLRLINDRNADLRIGSLEVVGNLRRIRYRAAMPARAEALTPHDIQTLVQLGGDLFHELFPRFMCVLFVDTDAAAHGPSPPVMLN